MNKHADVIIVGAGAAGLMAAWELAQTGRSVLVIEARDRIGGRIHTLHHPGFEGPVEGGAEFMHGDLPYTRMYLERAGIKTYKVKGEIWQQKNGTLEKQEDFIEDYSALNKKFKELETDISVQEFTSRFLKESQYETLRFSLHNYVEGYYAADPAKASTFALRDELNGADEDQYRMEQGYGPLVQFLFEECRKWNVRFLLSSIVKEINYGKGVIVSTANEQFHCSQVLVTIPIGTLQVGSIKFVPALEKERIHAISQLGFGPVIKTLLNFKEPFWLEKETAGGNDLSKMNFLFTEEKIPTWWTTYPKKTAQLTGWSAGSNATELKGLTNEAIMQTALESLSAIFTIPVDQLHSLLNSWQVFNWLDDPWCRGGYSFEVVNGKTFQQLVKKPVMNKLYFAGEGLYEDMEIGTVEAALQCGREIAHLLIAGSKN